MLGAAELLGINPTLFRRAVLRIALPRFSRSRRDGLPLPAVPSTLVGDVAYVVRIETLRATPLIIDRSTKAISALDRAFGLWPRLVNASPAKLLPETANLCRLSSNAIYLLAYRVANQKAARDALREGAHIAFRRAYRPHWPLFRDTRVVFPPRREKPSAHKRLTLISRRLHRIDRRPPRLSHRDVMPGLCSHKGVAPSASSARDSIGTLRQAPVGRTGCRQSRFRKRSIQGRHI